MSAIVIQIADVAAGRCCCATCARLDRRYPTQGYQLSLWRFVPLPGSGDQPDAIPLPIANPDALTAATVIESAPQGRPVEMNARGREAGGPVPCLK